MIRIFSTFALIATTLIATAAHAECVKEGTEVTLEGTLMNKAIYIKPGEFGWVPRNGFVQYMVLTLKDPFCLQSEGKKFENEFVIQVGTEATFTPAELHKGIAVRATGQVWREETAHHFQHVLLLGAEITRR